MPTYEYACKSCGQHLEVVQSFKDDSLTTCAVCGGPLRKVFGSIGIAFKGSGFYRNDSRPAASSGKASSDKASSDKASSDKGSSDTGSSDKAASGSGSSSSSESKGSSEGSKTDSKSDSKAASSGAS